MVSAERHGFLLWTLQSILHSTARGRKRQRQTIYDTAESIADMARIAEFACRREKITVLCRNVTGTFSKLNRSAILKGGEAFSLEPSFKRVVHLL
jgi:hypothetical protein